MPFPSLPLKALLAAAFLALATTPVCAQQDSVAQVLEQEEGHQLRLGFDILRPIINLAQNTRQSYEATLDYYWRKELYFVAEGGLGSSRYEYPDLSYTGNNTFLRLGIDKSILSRLGPGDWDGAFFGLRYGMAFMHRDEAHYTIVDSVWGNSSGTVPSKTFNAQWAELTGGVRVELWKGICAGWNVRARFLLNGRSFRDLSPDFIAGYGRGDKSTVFDFNLYLLYSIRWGSHPIALAKTQL
ncbi:MAG: hypothetical protein JST06_07380 [Bacteroidetes bacterium]|nr:hypothetical protein [Bacteroidota bacterium]MBS1628999.1 hypothetical protein [Bacteroidota bacterium]